MVLLSSGEVDMCSWGVCFFFIVTWTAEIYALAPLYALPFSDMGEDYWRISYVAFCLAASRRSPPKGKVRLEEHTSVLMYPLVCRPPG